MSKRADRARAESGLIFRDGKLVNKEDWYKANPTNQMLAERQAKVDDAVRAELAAKSEQPYYCPKCNRTHKPGSKIYKEHK